ncbi:hypothetical protein YC2023_053600 [Brassica napus]
MAVENLAVETSYPDLRLKITLLHTRVKTGSSNIGDGLAIGESQMSPEIFEALSARGIQKLFPIHPKIQDRAKDMN